MKSKDRVTVGWIDPGTVDGEFAMSMIQLNASRGNRIATMIRIAGSLLSRQRNELVAAFLADGSSEWLFIIDSDETITPEAFDRLCAAAHEVDRPIVAGLYFGAFPGSLHPTPVPMILRRNERGSFDSIDDFPADGVIPIDAAGTGALLVHRRVFEAMRDASNASPVGVHEAGIWCWFKDMPVAGQWVGEDIFFCLRATDMGFPIYAATGCRLRHRKTYWVTDAHHADFIARGRTP